MGNVDSRCKFDSGYLMLQTDKPFYEPGDLITGKIYLRIMRPIDAKHIELKINGKEKGSWWSWDHVHVKQPDGTTRVEA